MSLPAEDYLHGLISLVNELVVKIRHIYANKSLTTLKFSQDLL